jgi:hypothetical protein
VTDPTSWSPDDRTRASEALLRTEASLLTSALTAVWSASLVRTSIFLGVLSAAGVALGFVAQGGGVATDDFRMFALVVLPVTLLLGVATFVRLVQIQREAVVYISGLNRIRHFAQQQVPQSRPYYVLTAHDDELAIYRGPGSGMSRYPPRRRMLYLATQTQGIVGLMSAVVAGALGALLVAPLGVTVAWVAAGTSFFGLVAGLLLYWRRSLIEVQSAIQPINPTPPEEIGAPF